MMTIIETTEQNQIREYASLTFTTNNLTEISHVSRLCMARGDNSSENLATNSLLLQPIRREPDGTLQTSINKRHLVTTAPIHGNT
jgi:hypothetical protein